MRKQSIVATILAAVLLVLSAVAIAAQKPGRKGSSGTGPSVKQSARQEGPARRFDDWRVIGPGGGTMVSPTVSPHDSNVVVEHCDMTWLKMNLPAGTNGPMSLVLDPSTKGRMYLRAWGVARLAGDTGGGVFLSTDGGQTWKSIFSESQHVYDLTIDEQNPKVMYVCGFDAAAYRSSDGGATWTRIRGYNFKWGHRVVLDPVDQKSIYITTFGGSVWHGPATGDATSKEDILTPLN